MLAGLVYDANGERMSPTHANKKGTHYRYYVSQSLIKRSRPQASETACRVPAADLEGIVEQRICALLRDQTTMLIVNAADLARRWPTLPASDRRGLLHALIVRIDVGAEAIEISVRPKVLPAFVTHGLWEAAIRLGLEKVECRVVDHLDPMEQEALSLALNRIGESGKYDLDKLRDRMIALESHGIELISTGFTLPEIDQIKLKTLPAEDDCGGEGVDGTPVTSTSRSGDLFSLGRHKLLCGDALDESSYQHLLGGYTADAVFSDPPYNCRIEGFVGGLGKHKHEDFLMFAGKESDAEFRQFLKTYLRHCRTSCAPGAVLFACMDWRQIDRLLEAGDNAGLQRINVAVWSKGAGGMGGLYRSACEFVAVFCNGEQPATNNVALGAHGRNRTNVWEYAGANRQGSSAAQALVDHPTPKPVELIIDVILDVTHPDDTVLDPFSGSGTTIVASEQCDRIARCIELDPKYVDRAIRRWERLTGDHAVHVETGLAFAQLVEQRADADREGNNG